MKRLIFHDQMMAIVALLSADEVSFSVWATSSSQPLSPSERPCRENIFDNTFSGNKAQCKRLYVTDCTECSSALGVKKHSGLQLCTVPTNRNWRGAASSFNLII